MLPNKFEDIVILGASFESINIALQFLHKIRHEVSTVCNVRKYRVVLIAPNLRLFSPLAAPEALRPDWNNEVERYFIPFIHCFNAYDDDEFIFIKGKATGIDFGQRIIDIEPCSTNVRDSLGSRLHDRLAYHTLIIASGSTANSELLSLHGTEEPTIRALRQFQTDLGHARRCVIVGGGRMGVECAGRIATWANASRQAAASGCKSCMGCDDEMSWEESHDDSSHLVQGTRPTTPRSFLTSDRTLEIVLISGASRLLPHSHEKIARHAEATLEELGVRVVHDVRQVTAQALPGHAIKCVLANGQKLTGDIYVAATGCRPNTNFIPSAYKKADGRIIVNKGTLRVPSAGARVFAIGSCAAVEDTTHQDVLKSISVLLHNFKNDLLEYEMRLQNGRYYGLFNRLRLLKDVRFVPRMRHAHSLLISDQDAICLLKGMEMPSPITHMFVTR